MTIAQTLIGLMAVGFFSSVIGMCRVSQRYDRSSDEEYECWCECQRILIDAEKAKAKE